MVLSLRFIIHPFETCMGFRSALYCSSWLCRVRPLRVCICVGSSEDTHYCCLTFFPFVFQQLLKRLLL